MFDNSILPFRMLSVRCSLTRILLSVLILIASAWLPLNAEHCLDTPPITSNDDFFILGRIPQWHGAWTLDITGEVDQPLSFTLEDLRELPQSSVEATLECDYSSGPPLLVGNAVWTGVSLPELIELAAPKSTATTVTFRALDGYRRGPFPLEEVMQKTDALVVYEMNGEPLLKIQGWPARLALPGHVGNNWVRWLDSIEISRPITGESIRSATDVHRQVKSGVSQHLRMQLCPPNSLRTGQHVPIASLYTALDSASDLCYHVAGFADAY